MAGEWPEQGGLLPVIRARIAALQRLEESYSAAVSVGAIGQSTDLESPDATSKPEGQESSNSVDLPVGVFRNKSIPDAIKLYLKDGRRKQTGKEIATGLKEYGLHSTSKDFASIVYAGLHRLKKAGVVVRLKEGWDLAEYYPDRSKIVKKTSVPSKTNSKKRREGGLHKRIESILNANETKIFSPEEISTMIGVDVRGVRLAFALMEKKKKSTKIPTGGYSAYREVSPNQ